MGTNRTRGNRLAENLYKMLCYNVSELNNLDIDESSIDKEYDAFDLICYLMDTVIDELQSHYYFEQYNEKSEALSKINGEIDIEKSISTGVYASGKLYCSYNDLDIDNPTNRLIKYAANCLIDAIVEKKAGRTNKYTNYLRSLDYLLGELYQVGEIDEEIDEEYRDRCLEQQPWYCGPAICLSYFIIKWLIPKSGYDSYAVDTQDPASTIIETFVRSFLDKEYHKAKSLIGSRRKIMISAKSEGYREREVKLDVALRNRSTMKALILDCKDYKKTSISGGVYQLSAYYGEAKTAWDTENFKYSIDLVLLFSLQGRNEQDYKAPFHDCTGREHAVKVKFIDFDFWDFEDIKSKLIEIADETFG